MMFVELPKFPKKLEELESITDKWIYFIKEAPSLDVIPNTLAEVEEIEKALNFANQANLSRKELEVLHKQEVFLEDRRGEVILVQEAREKGRQEGIEIVRLSMQRLILGQLERKFSREITAIIRENIQQLSMEKLEDLGGAILSFNSLEDLSNWLAELDRE